jgi:hypothetical protein
MPADTSRRCVTRYGLFTYTHTSSCTALWPASNALQATKAACQDRLQSTVTVIFISIDSPWFLNVVERAKLPDFIEVLTTQTSPSPHISPSLNHTQVLPTILPPKHPYLPVNFVMPLTTHRRPSIALAALPVHSVAIVAAHDSVLTLIMGRIPKLHRRLSVASEEGSSLDELSRTITAGDLMLDCTLIIQSMSCTSFIFLDATNPDGSLTTPQFSFSALSLLHLVLVCRKNLK